MDPEKATSGYPNGYGYTSEGHAPGTAVYKPGEPTVNKDALLAQRNATLRKIKILAIPQIIFGVVFLGLGIAQIGVAAQGEYGWPLINIGSWLIAIMMIASGVLAILLSRKGDECRELEETPKELKQMLFGFYMINHMTNCSMIGWATAFCFTSVAACADEGNKNHKFCIPGKEANIALAAILGTFCLLSLVFIIPVYIIYFRNYKAFGIKPGCKNCCGTR